MIDQHQWLERSKMLRQQLEEHRRFLAWGDHLHRLEDLRRPYLEEETEREVTAILEGTVGRRHRLSLAGSSLVACPS